MELSLQDLLTVTGALVAVMIFTQILKQAWPNFNSVRYGALAAVGIGIAVVVLANAASLVDVRLGWGEAVWTGVLAGAAASGLYQAGKAAVSGGTE